MKTKNERFPPKIVKYGDYKNFDIEMFKSRRKLNVKTTTSSEKLFLKIFMELLNNFAPLKCK